MMMTTMVQQLHDNNNDTLDADDDAQWASLTRSVYTSNTKDSDDDDDARLRLELCRAFAGECRKRHLLSATSSSITIDDKWRREGEFWEFADTIFSMSNTTGLPEHDNSMTMESFLQEPVAARVTALKEWLESTFSCSTVGNTIGAYCIPKVDYDAVRQHTDPESLRVAESVFYLLRQGKLMAAVDLFNRHGGQWKAAVMMGGRYDRPVQDRQAWRQSVERLVVRETSWEAAWLGVLVGQTGPAVRVLRSTGRLSWRDVVWLNCVAWMDAACEQVLAGRRLENVKLDPIFVINNDVPKDHIYYACKATFLDHLDGDLAIQPSSTTSLPLTTSDDRFALHFALVVGGNVNLADSLLTEWILSRQSRVYVIWYISLLSSFEQAVHLTATLLVNAVDVKARRSIVYAAGEAGLRDVVGGAADEAIGTLGCPASVDLMTVAPIECAIRRINEHCRLIVSSSGDWRQSAIDLAAFLSTIPDAILSPQTMDRVADTDEAIVAEIATFMHLSRLGALFKDAQVMAHSKPPAPLGDFGSAAKFVERTEHAWRLRLASTAAAFCASARELLDDQTGAWWAPSISGDPFMQRLRHNYGQALREALVVATAYLMHDTTHDGK